MHKFLVSMKASAEHNRQEGALALREKCDQLREEVLVCAGEAVFGELAERCLEELGKRADTTFSRAVHTERLIRPAQL